MRVALTAGGTGGHVIPALSVFDALIARYPETICAFFGPDDRGERALVVPRGLPFHRVPSAGLRGRTPLAMVRGAWSVTKGVAIATRSLRRFRPDVVFSTGGYASFPCSVAARLLRRPLVVFLPDVEPGWAVRVESKLATRMATTTEAALRFLPDGKTRVTGYPVRPSFFSTTRQSARQSLALPLERPVLLVAGASQGSRTLNAAVFSALPALLPAFTVVHVTGAGDAGRALEVREQLDAAIRRWYVTSAFRDDLPAIMVAADLAVMRAGASILGELPAAGLPAILVPGTFAGGHQRDNASYLADAGVAVILEESALPSLGELVSSLLRDSGRLDAMRTAARRIARPGASDEIANLIAEVARR